MEPFDELLYDKIEDYLRKQLSPEETTRFEADLAADPALQEQVNLHRLEYEVRERMIRGQIKEQVQGWSKTQPNGNGKRPRPLWLWLLPVIILVTLFFWFWYRPEPGNIQPAPTIKPQQHPALLRDSLNKAPNGADTSKTRTIPQNNKPGNHGPIAEARLAKQEYINGLERDRKELNIRGDDMLQSIIDEYAGLDPQNDDYETSRLLLARAYMHTGNTAEATRWLRYVLRKNGPGSPEFQQAQWYLILTLLGQYPNGWSEVVEVLQKIAKKEGHPYHTDAVRLLSEMTARR